MGGDFISRDELAKKAIRYEIAGHKTAKVVLLKDVLELQAANVRPVRKGRWIYDCERVAGDGWTYRQHHCSECGRQTFELSKFCPECGADMRESLK